MATFNKYQNAVKALTESASQAVAEGETYKRVNDDTKNHNTRN